MLVFLIKTIRLYIPKKNNSLSIEMETKRQKNLEIMRQESKVYVKF